MSSDMSQMEQRVFPLLAQTSLLINHLNTTGKPHEAAPYARRCYYILDYARNAYRRPLKSEERRALDILCEKLFTELPRPWQRIGAPPHTVKGSPDD